MIDHFLAASRHGNLHLAARELSLTQTAVTKSLQNLEAALGARLFERSARGVTLTHFGQQFQRRAVRIMMQCDYLEREMQELLDGTGGRLTIGAGTVWSSALLPDILARIQGRSPTAEFVVLRSVGRRFQQQLTRREIDLGLGYLTHVSSTGGDFAFEPLAEIDTAYFARKDHPLHGAGALGLDDLRHFPFAMFQLDDALFDQIREKYLLLGHTIASPSYLADSISSVMRFVSRTDHVTCLPAPFLNVARGHGLLPLAVEDTPNFKSGAIYSREAAGYPLLEIVLRELRGVGEILRIGFDPEG